MIITESMILTEIGSQFTTNCDPNYVSFCFLVTINQQLYPTIAFGRFSSTIPKNR